MPFHVHSYVDDHLLEATSNTAKAAFATAIEWCVVRKLTAVLISDGNRNYSIAEFAFVMAVAEIAKTAASAERNGSEANG
jgi:hypothetical protein